MSKKPQVSHDDAMRILKDQVIPTLKSEGQFLSLIDAFKKTGTFLNCEDENEFSDDDLLIMVTIKSPFSLFFKKPYQKALTIDIDKDSYFTTFLQEEWEQFVTSVIVTVETAMKEKFSK